MLGLLLLLLLLALAAPGAAPPAGMAPPAPGLAPQEEVDILVYGVLQFSQAFQESHAAGGRKVELARRRLGRCRRSLEALGRQTGRARQAVGELRGAVEGLKAEGRALQLQTAGAAKALRATRGEWLSLARRVKELEETLAGPAGRDLAALQAQAERQNLALGALLGAAREQRLEAARQAEQLARIQQQVQGPTGGRGERPREPPAPGSRGRSRPGPGPGSQTVGSARTPRDGTRRGQPL